MRNGTLLVQEEPQTIIQNLCVSNLEEAFYKLSLQQGGKNEENRKYLKSIQPDSKLKKIHKNALLDISLDRILALLSKNQIHQRRNLM